MAAALPRCAPRPQSQGFNQSAQNPGRSKRSNHVMRATVSERAFAKAALLSAIEGKQRGALATPEDKAEIERLITKLERLNPNKKSLSAPQVSGKWRLVYTTSESILGTSRPFFLRPLGPIFQLIDGDNLLAKNWEAGWPFSAVFAELTPNSAIGVDVQFKQFRIFGLIPVNVNSDGGRGRGKLDITYVDEEMRISRGDKGNLFVLLQEDPKARIKRFGW